MLLRIRGYGKAELIVLSACKLLHAQFHTCAVNGDGLETAMGTDFVSGLSLSITQRNLIGKLEIVK